MPAPSTTTAPLPPLLLGQSVDPQTGVSTPAALNQKQQMWEWTARGFVTIACNVSGDQNNILLTPSLIGRNIPFYQEFMPFAFVAAQTSTSTITINVSSVNQLPAYSITGDVVGSGDIVAGRFYTAYYCAQNASYPERFVVAGVAQLIPGNAAFAPIPCTMALSGSVINLTTNPGAGGPLSLYTDLQLFTFRSTISGSTAALTVRIDGLVANAGQLITTQGGNAASAFATLAVNGVYVIGTEAPFGPGLLANFFIV